MYASIPGTGWLLLALVAATVAASPPARAQDLPAPPRLVIAAPAEKPVALQFPLLDGQRVVGMAMDVDGKLRDGVPVERTRGQTIFEEVTRAQIDPALLQVTQGNNYKLRVYPILPGKYKTVVIRYAESLYVRQGHYRFRLPLSYAEKLASLMIGEFEVAPPR